jgi:hypothetical protein
MGIIRDACLARDAAGRPRPTITELRRLIPPPAVVTIAEVVKILRLLRGSGEIPDEPAGTSASRAGLIEGLEQRRRAAEAEIEARRLASGPPAEPEETMDWRALVAEHLGRERRIRGESRR